MKREGTGRQLRPEEVDALEDEEAEEAGTFKKASQRFVIFECCDTTLHAICRLVTVSFILPHYRLSLLQLHL